MTFHSKFKVASYGGLLRFVTSTDGGISLRSAHKYPLVQLQGNDRIILEYYLHSPVKDNRYEVRYNDNDLFNVIRNFKRRYIPFLDFTSLYGNYTGDRITKLPERF